MLYLGTTDNALIHQAEAYLKELMPKPLASVVLYTLMLQSSHELVRQLCGVLLRRKVIAFYNRCAPPQRAELKANLISRLASEPTRLVRKAIVSVVAALGKALLPGHNWPELEAVLVACAGHPMEDGRELAMILVRELSEGIGRGMSEFAPALRPMFHALLNDASVKVRTATMRALGHMIQCIADTAQAAAYVEFIPVLLHMVQQCVLGDDDAAIEVLDNMSELVTHSSALVKPHVEAILRTTLTIAVAREASEGARTLSTDIIMDMIATRPKAVVNKGFLEPILDAGMVMQLEYDADEERDAAREAHEAGVDREDFVEDTTWTVGGRMIDILSLYVPSKKLYQPLVDRVMAWMQRPEWLYRHAAVVTLAVSVQGLREEMLPRLQTLLSFLLQTAGDSNEYVREAAGLAIVNVAEHMHPFCHDYASTFIPACLALMDDPSPYVASQGVIAIESYVDTMDLHAIKPFVQPLVAKLLSVLQRPSEAMWLHSSALSSIASVSIAAQALMRPFLRNLLEPLPALMQLTGEAQMTLRAAATECVGHVAVAVGKELFAPYLPVFMPLAEAGTALDHPELLRDTLMFFANMAQTLGEEFAPHVSELMMLMSTIIESSDGVHVIIPGRDDGALAERVLSLTTKDADEDEDAEATGTTRASSPAAAVAGDADGSDDDKYEDVDDDEKDDVGAGTRVITRVITSAMETKASAFLCMGKLASFVSAAFLPHIPRALALMERGVKYFDPKIRADAISSIVHTVVCIMKAFPVIPPAADDFASLQAPAADVYNIFITLMVQVLREDSSKEAVARACLNITEACRLMGSAAVRNHHEAIMAALSLLLREKAVCQQTQEDREDEAQRGGEEDGAEDEEHDCIVIDEAVDAVAAVARALGPKYFQFYATSVMKHVSRFLKPSRSSMDRCMAIGFYADIADAMGEAFAEFVRPTIETALACARETGSDDVRRNGIHACGMYVLKCPAATRPFVPHILTAIQGILATPRGGSASCEAAIDNAAAALARVMQVAPDAVPMQIAIPALAGILPLRDDFAEAGTILTVLLSALQNDAPPAVACAPQIVSACAHALQPEGSVPAEQRDIIIPHAVRRVAYSGGPAGKAALLEAARALPADMQALIAPLLSG